MSSPQSRPTKNPWYRMNAMRRAIGVVALMVGGVWLLQGIGVAKGSVMTGSAMWGVIGAVVFVAGVVILRQALRTARAEIAAERAAEAALAADPSPGSAAGAPHAPQGDEPDAGPHDVQRD